MPDPVKVFISYSHDSDKHTLRVRRYRTGSTTV